MATIASDRLAAATGIITSIAGGGSCGSLYCGDGGTATSARLQGTESVAVDSRFQSHLILVSMGVFGETRVCSRIKQLTARQFDLFQRPTDNSVEPVVAPEVSENEWP